MQKYIDELVITGQGGLYLETNLAVFPEVLITRIAPAFCSKAAATAEIATVSEVGVGREERARSSGRRGLLVGKRVADNYDKELTIEKRRITESRFGEETCFGHHFN